MESQVALTQEREGAGPGQGLAEKIEIIPILWDSLEN